MRKAMCAWLAMAMVLPLGAAAGVPTYQIQDLGSLGGGDTIPSDLNDAGQVTGDSVTVAGEYHAFLYTDGQMLDLGTLGGAQSFANALNEAGQVTGQSVDAEDHVHAFLYADGRLRDIGTIGGTFSSGNDINDTGQVTGISTTADGEFHPFLYASGEILDIVTPGERYGTGLAINDAGEVAGYYEARFETRGFLLDGGVVHDLVSSGFSFVRPRSRSINAMSHVTGTYRPSGINRAFLYRDGAAIDLGTLGGQFSDGFALNDASEVTGSATTPQGDSRAYLYADGAMRDLGTLGGDWSAGYAVNNSGEVVGRSALADGTVHAFVYRDGAMLRLDLAGLDAVESGADDINEAGQVLGWYTVAAGRDVRMRGFLATPITLLFTRLLDRANEVEAGSGIASTIEHGRSRYAAGDRGGACRGLRAAAQGIRAQAGKRELEPETAGSLETGAGSIALALGCQAATDVTSRPPMLSPARTPACRDSRSCAFPSR